MTDEVSIKCKGGDIIDLSLTEFEDVLDSGRCPDCGEAIVTVVPDTFEVECVNCTWSEENDWTAISAWLDQGCPRCGPALEIYSPLHIVGSFYHKVAVYDEYGNIIRAKTFERSARPDYWEVVIHFCKRQEFLSILKNGKIKACPTGYFYKPAVCFTETPLIHCGEIRNVHGPYGIAFRKSEIIKHGGNPALYLQDTLIQAQEQNGEFCDEIKPFINLLRIPATAPRNRKQKRVDFLHEREWRLASAVELDKVKPLGLVFPEGKKFTGPYGKDLLDYAYKYDEIVDT